LARRSLAFAGRSSLLGPALSDGEPGLRAAWSPRGIS